MKTNKILTGFILALVLSGCVIVVNQPSPQEKELLTIQQNAETQVKDVSTKVQSGNYTQPELQTMISQGEQSLQEGLNKINALNLPEKARQAGEKTKIYLESAQKTFGQLKALIEKFNEIKNQTTIIGSKAEKIAQEQLQQIQNGINSFQSQLSQIGQNIDQLGTQMMQIYNQVK